MTATVEWIDQTVVEKINNKPGRISIGVKPPNELVFYVPMGEGVAAVHVDATEFDNAMDLAHEKLVEHAADSAKAAAHDAPAEAHVGSPAPEHPFGKGLQNDGAGRLTRTGNAEDRGQTQGHAEKHHAPEAPVFRPEHDEGEPQKRKPTLPHGHSNK